MQAKCPACSTLLNIPDHLAGKPVKCQCGKVFKCSAPKKRPVVTQPAKRPAARRSFRITCPKCNKALNVEEKLLGQMVKCPCGTKLQTNAATVAQAAPTIAPAESFQLGASTNKLSSPKSLGSARRPTPQKSEGSFALGCVLVVGLITVVVGVCIFGGYMLYENVAKIASSPPQNATQRTTTEQTDNTIPNTNTPRNTRVDSFRWNGIGIGDSLATVQARKEVTEEKFDSIYSRTESNDDGSIEINFHTDRLSRKDGVEQVAITVQHGQVNKIEVVGDGSKFQEFVTSQVGGPSEIDNYRKGLIYRLNSYEDKIHVSDDENLYVGDRDYIVVDKAKKGNRSIRYANNLETLIVFGGGAERLLLAVSKLEVKQKELASEDAKRKEEEEGRLLFFAFFIATPLALLMTGGIFWLFLGAQNSRRGGAVIIGNDDNDDGILDVFQGGGF